MSGRHQPLHGAGYIDTADIACPTCDATYTVYETHECAPREYVDPRDYTCDYCGRTIYSGVIRQVTIGRSISCLCPTCYERQQDEYERLSDRGRMTDEPTYREAS